MSSDSASQDVRLREYREERGQTQQEVADRLADLAWWKYGVRVGLNADMVSKWERGEKRPSKLYRELLCLLYEGTRSQLGLVHADPTEEPGKDAARADAVFADTLVGTMSVLDDLGPARSVLQPRMFEVWREETVKRRSMLRLLSLMPTAAAASHGESLHPHGELSAGDDVRASTLDELVAKYERLYHSTRPEHLLVPVLAHLRTVDDLLRRQPRPSERCHLLRNQGRTGLLAGRIAFFDLHDSFSARAYYSLALDAARDGNDHLLASAIMGHTAFVPAAENNIASARDYLRGAVYHLGRRPHALVASWLAAVEAETESDAEVEHAALSAIQRAEERMRGHDDTPAPPWFDYYDATRLNGFKGYACLRFRRFEEAGESLAFAASALAATATKQRAVFLTDLAAVKLRAGEVDEACHEAGQAAALLRQANYATATDRLHTFRQCIHHWRNHPAVRDLDERLASI